MYSYLYTFSVILSASSQGRTGTSIRSTDFHTTIVFTTLSVCGLDYTFTVPFGLGVPRLVSTPSSCDAWLGIAILQVSPNLRNYTHKVSQMRLNFHKSGVSTDSTTLPKNLRFVSNRIILDKLPKCQLHFFL